MLDPGLPYLALQPWPEVSCGAFFGFSPDSEGVLGVLSFLRLSHVVQRREQLDRDDVHLPGDPYGWGDRHLGRTRFVEQLYRSTELGCRLHSLECVGHISSLGGCRDPPRCFEQRLAGAAGRDWGSLFGGSFLRVGPGTGPGPVVGCLLRVFGDCVLLFLPVWVVLWTLGADDSDGLPQLFHRTRLSHRSRLHQPWTARSFAG
mmetsp:Transcript_49788/g.108466  ORF Transcript_49788/g.108466 Transcript_49788/m.108466 type:complete len:203 (+) Transcript_49788:96-704(+)